MALVTLAELRTNIGSTIRDTQINSLIDSFINYTLQEIWQFHPWTFKRRKTTFATVADQEDYFLDEEVDTIALLRDINTPRKLVYVPDHIFYQFRPDPENTSSSNPRFYRLWEETGFLASLSTDDTLNVVSSSTSDGSSFTVIIVGRNTNGLIVSESVTLNGTTAVTTSTTWDAGGLMQVSKSGQTTGTITVSETTAGTTLARISPEESAPRYKKLSLYPIPSSVITLYLEYYERMRLLVNSADVPQIDHKWTWVIREGALAKAWEYKQNEQAAAMHRQLFVQGLVLMRQQDERNLDYVPVLQPRPMLRVGNVVRESDSVSDNFPVYSLRF